MSGPQIKSAPVLDGPIPFIICIGDSLTEFACQPNGWASHLQHHFVSRRDILLRGMSGYNSRWLLKCLDKIVPSQQPMPQSQHIAAITLLVGTNDAVNPNAKSGPGWPQQHVPVEEFEDNLRIMVEHLASVRNADGSRPIVVVMSPPPQDGEDWHKFMMPMLGDDIGEDEQQQQQQQAELPKQRSLATVESYAKAVQRVVGNAKSEQARSSGGGDDDVSTKRLVFIDLFNSMVADTKGWRRFLSADGVHLSEDGNKFLFERLSKALASIEGSADELPRHTPHFFDVDTAFS
mmetsp:Transcript_14453/g.31329  ORF Transcript_14453/g.31329 Transcript_14453/m.31329 type:complete len:291 (+) Transcript_14453:268-1140(+)